MEATSTEIDRLYSESLAIEDILRKAGAFSDLNSFSDIFRKSLLLAIASHFENVICKVIRDFVSNSTNNKSLPEFVNNKAITRQYHTYFNWTGNNINSFLGLFGSDFKATISADIGNNNLDKSIKAFLELGNERNRLVHGDFATYQMEKTSSEIYEQYENARKFLDHLHGWFKVESITTN